MDVAVLDKYLRSVPPYVFFAIYATLAVIFFVGTFVYRMRKGRGFWNALGWATWNAATLFLPFFFFSGHLYTKREREQDARKDRRSGNLTDEF